MTTRMLLSLSLSLVFCALMAWPSRAGAQTGPIVGWGYNTFGQANPPVESQEYVYLAVAAGFEHSVAIRANGTVVAWGSNQFGQTTLPSILNTRSVRAIAAGYHHSLAIIDNPGQPDDGHVVAWGDNSWARATCHHRLERRSRSQPVNTGAWRSAPLMVESCPGLRN